MTKTKALEAEAGATFVTLLKRQRLARGLTQTALAKKLNLKSQSTVSFWESGEAIPSPSLIPKLARVLGITPMQLTKLIEPEEQAAGVK